MGQKLKILLLGVLFVSTNFAQEWQSISHEQYDCACPWSSANNSSFKSFKINPYSNDIWSNYLEKVYTISNLGVYKEYNGQNTPSFYNSDPFADFVFTPTSVYAARYGRGIYRFQNDEWLNLLPNYAPRNISVDGDTIWTSDDLDNEFYKITPNLIELIESPRFHRSQHRKGNFWGSFFDLYWIYKLDTNNERILFNADTTILLDITNYDFKFAKNTDSLFVAGSLGLSIAYENQFIDSIDIFSSIDMPNSGILEFEFDNEDNIWALFGEIAPNPNFTIPHSLAYYTQSTRTWSKFYDSDNSPIDFTQEMTIEVDTAGNLWVSQGLFLHVLKINEVPSWLNTNEKTLNSAVKIYPNPVENVLTISNEKELFNKFSIADISGKILLEKNFEQISSNTIDVSSLQKGSYFLVLEGQNGNTTSKFQKN